MIYKKEYSRSFNQPCCGHLAVKVSLLLSYFEFGEDGFCSLVLGFFLGLAATRGNNITHANSVLESRFVHGSFNLQTEEEITQQHFFKNPSFGKKAFLASKLNNPIHQNTLP